MPLSLIRDQSRQGHPLRVVPTLRRCYSSRRRPSYIHSSLVGLGKEGTKLAARLKLGKAAGGEPPVFIDWPKCLREIGRAEARRLGLPWASVTRWKRRLRSGLLLENGHSGRALARLNAALFGSA